MKCKKCGSENVLIQQVTVEEKTKSKSNHYFVHHGILYWLLIGWWWEIIKLFGRFMLAVCTFGVSILFRHKHKVGVTNGTSTTKMKMKTVCTCQGCGNVWYV